MRAAYQSPYASARTCRRCSLCGSPFTMSVHPERPRVAFSRVQKACCAATEGGGAGGAVQSFSLREMKQWYRLRDRQNLPIFIEICPHNSRIGQEYCSIYCLLRSSSKIKRSCPDRIRIDPLSGKWKAE